MTVILAVWIEASFERAPLLVIFVKTAAKPIFLPIFFDPSCKLLFHFDVKFYTAGSVVFTTFFSAFSPL